MPTTTYRAIAPNNSESFWGFTFPSDESDNKARIEHGRISRIGNIREIKFEVVIIGSGMRSALDVELTIIQSVAEDFNKALSEKLQKELAGLNITLTPVSGTMMPRKLSFTLPFSEVNKILHLLLDVIDTTDFLPLPLKEDICRWLNCSYIKYRETQLLKALRDFLLPWDSYHPNNNGARNVIPNEGDNKHVKEQKNRQEQQASQLANVPSSLDVNDAVEINNNKRVHDVTNPVYEKAFTEACRIAGTAGSPALFLKMARLLQTKGFEVYAMRAAEAGLALIKNHSTIRLYTPPLIQQGLNYVIGMSHRHLAPIVADDTEEKTPKELLEAIKYLLEAGPTKEAGEEMTAIFANLTKLSADPLQSRIAIGHSHYENLVGVIQLVRNLKRSSLMSTPQPERVLLLSRSSPVDPTSIANTNTAAEANASTSTRLSGV